MPSTLGKCIVKCAQNIEEGFYFGQPKKGSLARILFGWIWVSFGPVVLRGEAHLGWHIGVQHIRLQNDLNVARWTALTLQFLFWKCKRPLQAVLVDWNPPPGGNIIFEGILFAKLLLICVDCHKSTFSVQFFLRKWDLWFEVLLQKLHTNYDSKCQVLTSTGTWGPDNSLTSCWQAMAISRQGGGR